MKSNPLLSLGTLLRSHFSMFFFLSKSGGIFLSIFASTHNPGISHLPHILYPSLQPLPLPDRHSLTSPSLSTLPCCQLCQLSWLKVAFGIRNIFLMIAPISQFFGISIPAWDVAPAWPHSASQLLPALVPIGLPLCYHQQEQD